MFVRAGGRCVSHNQTISAQFLIVDELRTLLNRLALEVVTSSDEVIPLNCCDMGSCRFVWMARFG